MTLPLGGVCFKPPRTPKKKVMVAWEREAVSVPSREVSCRAREAAVGGRTVGAGVW